MDIESDFHYTRFNMIGLLSDSHDNRPALREAVDLFNRMGCDLVIHAGDFVAPFAARELVELNCGVKAVYGNCDGERKGLAEALAPIGGIKEEPLILTYQEMRILVSHHPFSNAEHIRITAPDLLVFGHTHKPEIRREGRTLLINPGETGGWVSGKRTVAIFDLQTGEAEILPL